MRSLVRVLATGALLAIIIAVAGTSGSVLAGSAPERYTMDESYCWESGPEKYCFELKGFMQFKTFANGDILGVGPFSEHVTAYWDGVMVGESFVQTIEQVRFIDGGQADLKSNVHTRWTGDGEGCVSTYILRMVDYEVVLEGWHGPDCS